MAVMVADKDSVQAGEWTSFDEFVTVRAGALWRAAWLLTQDRGKAEDLVQTALAKTYGRFDKLNQQPGGYEAYLRRTIYTTYVSWWRRRWNGEVPSPMDHEASYAPTRAIETSLDLEKALATLTKTQRAVIVLRYYEDRTEADTAEMLGISIGSVKSHTSRALGKLRENQLLKEDR